MNILQTTVRWKIHDGKLNEFKKFGEECLSVVKENNQNLLQYDWFFSEDQTECVIREKFPDSNALLAHMSNIGDLLGKLLEVADFTGEIYGGPSEELLNATAGLNLKAYSYYQGI